MRDMASPLRGLYQSRLMVLGRCSGMNGVRLMQTVANRYPDLPRLLMSGLPRELLATRFALPESEFLLAKPFSMAQFDIALHELKQRFPRHSP